MKISIFGLGYVGTTSAACLAEKGHDIIGVDPNQTKVNLINQGKTPIIEKGLNELIQKHVAAGKLKALTSLEKAIADSVLSFICVGTPSQTNGNLDLKYVRRVCETIGVELKKKDHYHTIVVRSTVMPGTMRDVVIPTLEEYSAKKAGQDFGVCFNPEFLREGTAIDDFFQPPKTVIGSVDKRGQELLSGLFADLEAPMIHTALELAEMVKYVDNIWHALKVAFGNEVGSLAKVLGIDGQALMQIFLQDKKLNISPAYLNPGFAFGGSCLPKDLRALVYKSRRVDLDLPIINAILPSNRCHIERGLSLITEKGNKKVGILGFSFKAGTDDLRESPVVELIERLIGKGYDIRLFDENVQMASLMGANRDYILNHIPHISKLMVPNIEDVLTHADTILVGNDSPEFKNITKRLNRNQVLVDFVRITASASDGDAYDGICW
jgi:GDP-mannose 6-dehydrogenase